MVWLRSNWRWAALNLFALAVLIYVLSQGSTDFNAETFDPGLESGKWAIRFLLICLAMTPLRVYFGWRGAIKLRKPVGLISFGFALVHLWFFLSDERFDWTSWLANPLPLFLMLGVLGLIILLALALTSNRRAMRRLGRNWKRLHRLVYAAALLVTLHGLLAVGSSKKMLHDPRAESELTLYLILFIVLLLVRIPSLRRAIKELTRQIWQTQKIESV